MPELPEVETVVRQLNLVLVGRGIQDVKVLREKSARSDLEELVGRRVVGVSRFAKNIVVELENNEQKTRSNEIYLLVHLKMTGQLVFDENNQLSNSNFQRKGNRVVGGHPSRDWVGELPSKHTRIVLTFEDGSKLFFNDQRVFGWMKTVTSDELRVKREKLPPDVVDEEFTLEYLSGVLKRSGRAVKLVILDQSKMGGMGNIYVCDALWRARIKPQKKAYRLTRIETKRLWESMRFVLSQGIELGGASYSNFVDTKGLGGKYQEHFLTYDREGEKCKRRSPDGDRFICGGVIKKIKLGGRGTYFCPKCQK